MKKIDKSILDELKIYALSNRGQEVCGLICEKNGIIKFLKCKNIASNPKKFFTINPEDIEKCALKYNILYCFHSHINKNGFSAEDISSSLSSGFSYIMYNILQDKFYFFDAKKYNFYKKYINLPYINGINDCWGIIGKYLNEQAKISISDPEPGRHNCEDIDLPWDYKTRKKWMEDNNLNKILVKSQEELKPLDIVVGKTKTDKIATFGCLVLDDNLILAQNQREKSKIESFRKGYLKYIDYVARFKFNE